MYIMQGVYPAMPTPMNEDGSALDLDVVKPLCDAVLDQGVQGVFICGTTGEGVLLTAEEKLAFIQSMVEAVSGRAEVIVQIACANFAGTLKVARIAPKMGVQAISLVQPFFYACDDEAQYQYVARIAEAIDDFPLYLYNIPQNSGNDLQPQTVRRLLAQFPHIRGVKESGSIDNIYQWFDFPQDRFQVVCGIDAEFFSALEKGGQALVSSTTNFQARHFVSLLDAWQAGDRDKARHYQRQANRLLSMIDMGNQIACIKEYYRLRGIDIGGVRSPLRSLSASEADALRKSLKELELL